MHYAPQMRQPEPSNGDRGVREQFSQIGRLSQLAAKVWAESFVRHRGIAWLAIAALTLACILLGILGKSGESISASNENHIGDSPKRTVGADFAVGRREPISARDVMVLDGKTIQFRGHTVRLVGFDAPEAGGKAFCRREKEIGLRATEQLSRLVAGGGLDLRLVPCACPTGSQGTAACNDGNACGELRSYGRDIGRIMTTYLLAKPQVCSANSCPPVKPWC